MKYVHLKHVEMFKEMTQLTLVDETRELLIYPHLFQLTYFVLILGMLFPKSNSHFAQSHFEVSLAVVFLLSLPRCVTIFTWVFSKEEKEEKI